jgi:hypothetical protein
MAISLGSSSISDLKLGTSAVTKVYLGSTQVWPVGGAIITSSIDEQGDCSGDVSGLYVFEQSSTDGSGVGAKFAVTVSYNQRKNKSFVSAQQINSGDEGSGYAVGDLITLNPGPTGSTWVTDPIIEVLSVTT